VKYYFWDDLLLFKLRVDGTHRKCILEEETSSVLLHRHSSLYEGHASTYKMTAKISQADLFWLSLFKDARDYVMTCDKY
jgi:Integrase zinc binding domain